MKYFLMKYFWLVLALWPVVGIAVALLWSRLHQTEASTLGEIDEGHGHGEEQGLGAKQAVK